MNNVGAGAGWAFLGLMVVAGCGGSARSSGANGSAGAPSVEGVAGAPAIDTSGQPSTLAMTCPVGAGRVALSLPCHVGLPLGGGALGLAVTECDLTDQADGQRLPPIQLMIDLSVLAKQLNVPQEIPSRNVPSPPPGGYGTIAAYPGERFSGSLSGTATFSQVDATERVFVGRLSDAHFTWVGSRDSFSCTVSDSPFWAVAGDFI